MSEIKAAVTVQHSGIAVEYLEESNKWRFELRGRERNADSLTQAKEWIDKPEPEKKPSKNFKRFEVVCCNGYSGPLKRNRIVVTVTSIASDRYRDDKSNPSAAWVLKSDGERAKQGVHSLYPIHETNAKKWEEYDKLTEESERIEKEMKRVLNSIETLNLKPYLLAEESVPTS